jgi:hypothetical protein
MNKRASLGLVAIAAGFIGPVFGIYPAFGFAAESFLTIERSTSSTEDSELSAELDAEGPLIPTNETQEAFGYGIITDAGDDVILIAHTHSGILDSEAQGFIDDPIWHNHFVRLGEVEQCGEDKGILEITWQSPGSIEINDNIASIRDIPTDGFEGWDSTTGESLSMTLGEHVSDVISFKLDPVFGEDGLEAVCITDIRSAEEVVNSE